MYIHRVFLCKRVLRLQTVSLTVCRWCRTSRRRWPCSPREPSGCAGVWSRWPSPWADVSLADMFGWSEPLACISTSSAATTTLWRATCSGHRSTRRTHLNLGRFATSGLVCVFICFFCIFPHHHIGQLC